jgi:murein DD-endopeptidase MepM/ murein hydrolase activator NlpD
LAFAFGQVVVFPVAPTDPSLLGGDPAHIAPAPAHPIRLDANGKPAYLARFSDGPRRVPQARGGSQERAKKLGIGSTDQARRFLGSAPRTALLQAVPGSAPHDLLWPVVQGKFGRGFGYTRTLRTDLPHNGVDIGAPKGAVIRAVADGLVVYSDNGLRGFGNCVMILHKNGWLSLYAHSERTTVQAGYLVKRGERIALVGQTGYAWGPHLHFELRDNGRLRDPERLFVGRKSDEVTGPLVSLAQASSAPSRPHRKVKAR